MLLLHLQSCMFLSSVPARLQNNPLQSESHFSSTVNFVCWHCSIIFVFYFLFKLFPISETRCHHLHNGIKSVKIFADSLCISLISLNGLYGEETWEVQPRHWTAQLLEKNKCGDCQWSKTIPASPVHPAAIYSQRWAQAAFWEEHCSSKSRQQAFVIF